GCVGRAATRIPRELVDRCLLRAPPPLAAIVAAIDGAASDAELASAIGRFVDVAARWIGIQAFAARASLGPSQANEIVAAVREAAPDAGGWLRVAAGLVGTAGASRVPVPSLPAGGGGRRGRVAAGPGAARR